jgi:hypothetical protein
MENLEAEIQCKNLIVECSWCNFIKYNLVWGNSFESCR